METHLATRSFFVGSGLTIADIALYAYTHVAEEGGFALEPFPNVRGWLARVAVDPVARAGPPLLDPLFPLPPQMALAPPRRSRLVRRFPALLSLPVPLLMLLQSP
jgi:glutathione S-transferase